VDAVASYEKALAEVPQSRPAQRNLGIVLVKIADYERALELLVGVAKEYSQDPEVHYFLGEACRGLRRFSEAAKHYQAGLRIQANDLRLIKALAWTWHKMGQNAWTVQLIEPLVAQSHPFVVWGCRIKRPSHREQSSRGRSGRRHAVAHGPWQRLPGQA
jgi:tetratricopeptide (TPR) repeat protein